MEIELQAKFIQNLHHQRDEGFTLVELLVVIIILGILAGIALPSFLSQSAKAKQAEAKHNIGLVNRVQTAYRAENSTFATSFDILATGTMFGTNTYNSINYTYNLDATQDTSKITVTNQDSSVKMYQGGSVRFVNANNQGVISSIICEAVSSGSGTSVSPTLDSTATSPTTAISCSSADYRSL
ncbi:type IV pilin-like G/H family protein [Chamaesiphon sp.]|uniref:type IV pilin-like G/H family protein n=1 Tax=Chamaesiphon sp. TaxID=2814140 RepID=UPI0035943C78